MPLLLAFLLAASAASAACRSRGSAAAAQPSQSMEEFTMAQTVDGKRAWRLDARRAVISNAGDALLEKPSVLFYQGGRHASTAVAKKATVNGESQMIVLEEDVVIIGHEEKTTLRTSRLEYSEQDRRFRTDRRVDIERPGGRLRGRGMEGDAALSEITIYKQETVVQ